MKRILEQVKVVCVSCRPLSGGSGSTPQRILVLYGALVIAALALTTWQRPCSQDQEIGPYKNSIIIYSCIRCETYTILKQAYRSSFLSVAHHEVHLALGGQSSKLSYSVSLGVMCIMRGWGWEDTGSDNKRNMIY